MGSKLGLLGLGLTVAGAAISIAKNQLEDKKRKEEMESMIDKKLDEKFQDYCTADQPKAETNILDTEYKL